MPHKSHTLLWGFIPRDPHRHLISVARSNLANEPGGATQLYTLCGRGPRSALRILRQGLAVAEIAAQPLPGNPTAVWSVKRAATDEYDGYIIVSFTNATLVLSIGETVEETLDSGLEGTGERHGETGML